MISIHHEDHKWANEASRRSADRRKRRRREVAVITVVAEISKGMTFVRNFMGRRKERTRTRRGREEGVLDGRMDGGGHGWRRDGGRI